MRKIILTDVDNTLLAFGKALQAWLADQGHHSPGPHDLDDIYCISTFLGCSFEDVHRFLHEFALTPSYETLPPLEGAVEAVRSLSQRGYEFVAVTACQDDERTVEARRRNLEAVFGIEWPTIHATGFKNGVAGGKHACLSAYQPAVWIEDKLSEALVGASLGHHTILIDYPYNRAESEGLNRVFHWGQIVEAIDAFEQSAGA